MADKKLNIKVRTDGAKRAKKELKGVSGGMASMGKAAAKAGAIFFAAKGLISGFSKIIELAGAQELAEKKLESALGKTSKALLAQASSLQQFSRFGDEAIIEAQALIAAFVDDEAAIAKATQATLDLAAAKGMDLTAAADLVSKTLGSSTNAMSRYGIEVTGAVGSTERLDTLTGNIAEKFGGMARDQVDTMTGAIDQMKNAMGDTAEVIGMVMAPAIVSASKMMTTFFQTVSDSIHNFKISFSDSTAEQIKFFRVNVRGAKEALPILQERLSQTGMSSEDLGKNIGIIKLSLDNMNKAIKDLPEGAPLMDPLIGQFQLLLAAAEAMQKTGGGKGVASEFKGASKAMADLAISGGSFSDALSGVLQKQLLITAQLELQKLLQSGLGALIPGGGFLAKGLNFLFGASPTQVAPTASGASNSKITINQNFGGMGVIDHNFAANSIIPAINKAISTGQARIG